MSEKVRVLYFVDRMLRGGIQTFVIENMKHMDREKVQIDYLLLDDGVHYDLEDTLKEMGSEVYKLKGIWLRKPTDYFKYFKAIDNFFKEHNDYKVVHLHSSSKNFYVLKSAKKYGIPVRIAHSHNIGFQSKSKLQILIGNLCKPLLKMYATDYFACSEIAGEWLFGKNAVKKNKVKVIHNAVDLDKYKFNEEKRNELRKKLNIEDKFVVGHVGRFTNQKNHTFLIDIFNEIHKKRPDSVLMLVGTGEKEKEIHEKVDRLGLTKDVLFMGFQNNVNEYMWAMDVFVFPSLYEGLGLVLIEAQATGMKCFTSKDVVPKEAQVSTLLQYVSLSDSEVIWANKIGECKVTRGNVYIDIKRCQYDISDTGKELQEYYLKSERKENV